MGGFGSVRFSIRIEGGRRASSKSPLRDILPEEPDRLTRVCCADLVEMAEMKALDSPAGEEAQVLAPTVLPVV